MSAQRADPGAVLCGMASSPEPGSWDWEGRSGGEWGWGAVLVPPPSDPKHAEEQWP